MCEYFCQICFPLLLLYYWKFIIPLSFSSVVNIIEFKRIERDFVVSHDDWDHCEFGNSPLLLEFGGIQSS